MVDRTVTEQIVREAPEIEAAKLGLLTSAKTLADQPINLPDYQVPDFSNLQKSAFGLAGAAAEGWGGRQPDWGYQPYGQGPMAQGQPQGIGGYQPLLREGTQSFRRGLGSLGQANWAAAGTGGQFGQPRFPFYGDPRSQLQGQNPWRPRPPTFTHALGGQQQYQGGPPIGGMGFTPNYASGIGGQGQFTPSGVGSFFNPYEEAVVQQTMADIGRQGDIERTRLGAQAVGAGAFGGSRQAIAEQELNRNVLEQQARAAGGLRQQGYQQAAQAAQQAFEEAQRRRLQASTTGLTTAQQAFEDAQRRRQQQSQLYSGIGQAQAGIGAQQLAGSQFAQQAGLRDINLLSTLGGQQQQQAQALAEAHRRTQQEQLYEPYSRVSFLSDIYKGAPSSQTVLGSQLSPSAPAPSAFQQVAGLGTGLLGTAAAASSIGKLF